MSTPLTKETRNRIYIKFGIGVEFSCALIDKLMRTKKSLAEKQLTITPSNYDTLIALINTLTHICYVTANMQTAYRQYLSAKIPHEERCAIASLNVFMNEGYKRMYGYRKLIKESFWIDKIGAICDMLQPEYQTEYTQLKDELVAIGRSDVFDKDSRDFYTHLDVDVDKVYNMLINLNAEVTTNRAIEFIEMFNKLLSFITRVFEIKSNEILGCNGIEK